MIKKLNLKTIMFAVIAIAMFVCGISALASFANIKPASINENSEKVSKIVGAVEYEARIGDNYYATLEEAFDAVCASTSNQTCTIYVLAPEISIDKTLRVVDDSNNSSYQHHEVTLLCEGTDVTITRNFDDVMFTIGGGSSCELIIGNSENEQYKFTMNGNNKAYSMFHVGYGILCIYSGIYMGNGDSQATVGPEKGGCVNVTNGDASATIIGGEFRNFKATYGGILSSRTKGSTSFVCGGTFTNNTASYGGAIFASNVVIGCETKIQNNTAVIGGGVFASNVMFFEDLSAMDASLVGELVVTNNTATGSSELDVSSGIGNDVFCVHGDIIDGTFGDVALGGGDVLNIANGTIDKISFSAVEVGSIPATGTINISGDFVLNDAIELDGLDGQSITVSAFTDSLIGATYTPTELANNYKIDGSSATFANYYKDSGKALVTYADGVSVDASDFACTNGAVILGSEVTDGNVLSLYLTASADTPSTGFVDEQLLPMLAIGVVSILLIGFVATNKKIKIFTK